MKKNSILRRSIQTISAIFMIVFFLRQDYSRVDPPFFTGAGWLDPLVGLGAVMTGHRSFLLILTIGMLIIAVLFGRFFCGWICPVGTLLDLGTFIKKMIHRPDLKLKEKTIWILEFCRWVVFGCVIGLICAGFQSILLFNPLIILPRDIYRSLNVLIPWSIGFVFIIGLLIFPRFWCRFVCPTGSLFNLLSRFKGKKRGITEECKLCSACIRRCSIQNISILSDKAKEVTRKASFGYDCLNCGECKRTCPLQCVSDETKVDGVLIGGRRDFITSTGFGLGALALGMFGQNSYLNTSPTIHRWPRLMRPPGALPEKSFIDSCTRCGQCLQVCPTKVLVPSGLESTLDGLWTPRFIPYRGLTPGRCMFCMACVKVCPTGALKDIPVDKIRLGEAKIDHTRCVAWTKNTRCLLCVETCPQFAITIDANHHPVINRNLCNGCGACEAHCPIEGSAVLLTNAGEVRFTV